eukprot:3671996-Prymnesium_polylepis.1
MRAADGVAFTSVEFEVYNVYVTDLVMIGAEIVALPVLAWVTEYGGRRITVAATIAICSVGFFVIQVRAGRRGAGRTVQETLGGAVRAVQAAGRDASGP